MKCAGRCKTARTIAVELLSNPPCGAAPTNFATSMLSVRPVCRIGPRSLGRVPALRCQAAVDKMAVSRVALRFADAYFSERGDVEGGSLGSRAWSKNHLRPIRGFCRVRPRTVPGSPNVHH